MNVLFVCTGNTCRSPMAEKILEKKALEQNLNITVKSAGIAAVQGHSASKNARKVMKELGVDDRHETQQVNAELLDWADMILTMTMNHKQYLLQQNQAVYDKVYTLKEFAELHSEANDDRNRLNQLYAEVEFKKQDFLKRHLPSMKQLEERYKKLTDELREIEAELNQYHLMLEDAIRLELKEIRRLEDNLPEVDISDPFGGDLKMYQKTALQIEKAIDEFISSKRFKA